MRTITIKEIEGINFKNHENITLEFGTLNTIKGMNGEGKSSIGEIYSWCLGGVDMMGWSKFDPTPTDRTVDKVFASVLLQVDDKDILFGRELKKGKAVYYINESVKTATEFNAIVMSIFGGAKIGEAMDMALSLYNPSYFPSMPWADQRNMIMKHMSPPAMKEVLKDLPKLQADKLKEAFKKKNAAEIEKDNKLNKTNKEKELIAGKATLQTLEGQLKGVAVENLESIKVALKAVEKAIDANVEVRIDYQNKKARLITKENSLKNILSQIDVIKQKNAESKAQTTCLSCNQELTEETKKVVHANLNTEYKALKKLHDDLKAEIDAVELPILPDEEVHNALLVQERDLSTKVNIETNRLKAVETVEAARTKVDDVQASLNDSIFLLDAIKSYNAKAAEIQAEDVKKLFKTLSIRLWTIPKDGDKTPAFEIEMNGKPYSKLSLGERAVAGAELIGVLMDQTEIYSTVFFDNAESITRSVWNLTPANTPQIIAAYATPQTFEYDEEGNAIMTYDGSLKVEVIQS